MRRPLCFGRGVYGLALLSATLTLGVAREPSASTAPSAMPTVQSTMPTASPAAAFASPDEADRAKKIVGLQKYYADLYGDPLKQKNRLSRLIAIISLSRIDGDALTAKLMSAMADPDELVGQLAWEALHARQASLGVETRSGWIIGGCDIAKRGGFPGETLGALIAAASEQPAASLKPMPDLLIRLVEENDLKSPAGKATLDAAQKSIAIWNDPKIVQPLLTRLSKPALTLRIAHMLGGLPDAPAESDDAAATRTAYTKFGRDLKLTPPTTRPTYAGKSTLFKAPEVIVDPDDAKWRKELELHDLKIDGVDVAFCVDATPSMEVSNPYVAGYVDTVASLMGLMSDRVRTGAIYYRHELNPLLFDVCCSKWQSHPGDYAVKALALTSKPAELVEQMRQQVVGGKGTGHQGNGAYAGGIEGAMKLMQWNPKAKRIIACTGDAKATPGSEKALVALSAKAKAEGFILIFIARDPHAAEAVAEASTASTGQPPIIYGPDIDKVKDIASTGASGAALENFKGTAFETMTTRILQLSIPPDYQNRIEPLLAATLPILQAHAATETTIKKSR